MKYIVGIDEVGRGAIAGPVAVGVVAVPVDFVFWEGVRDSKQLSKRKRDDFFEKVKNDKNIFWEVSRVRSQEVDKRAVHLAVNLALKRAFSRLLSRLDGEIGRIIMDYGLKLDWLGVGVEVYKRADENFLVVALASIMAKVSRDRYMRRQALKWPEHGFEHHVGYGTKEHYRKIKKYGLTDMHRKSFLRDISDDISV